MIALSVDDLTSRLVLIAGLALIALIAAGWRKPARATVRTPRFRVGRTTAAPFGVPVVRQPLVGYRRPGIIHRFLALGTMGVLAVIAGAVLAILTTFSAVWGVVKLTDLLG